MKQKKRGPGRPPGSGKKAQPEVRQKRKYTRRTHVDESATTAEVPASPELETGIELITYIKQLSKATGVPFGEVLKSLEFADEADYRELQSRKLRKVSKRILAVCDNILEIATQDIPNLVGVFLKFAQDNDLGNPIDLNPAKVVRPSKGEKQGPELRKRLVAISFSVNGQVVTMACPTNEAVGTLCAIAIKEGGIEVGNDERVKGALVFRKGEQVHLDLIKPLSESGVLEGEQIVVRLGFNTGEQAE